jgi:hypothetical protein
MRLEPGGAIRARVIGPDGRIVEDALLLAEDAAGHAYASGETPGAGAEGDLRIEGLPPGTYTVSAVSLRHAFDRRTGVRFEGGELLLEFGLSPGGVLEVACADEAGAPAPRAALDLRLPDGGRVPTSFFESLFAPSRSGPDGILRRERLAAGAYRGALRTEDGREASFEALIRDGETTRIAVTLRRPPGR